MSTTADDFKKTLLGIKKIYHHAYINNGTEIIKLFKEFHEKDIFRFEISDDEEEDESKKLWKQCCETKNVEVIKRAVEDIVYETENIVVMPFNDIMINILDDDTLVKLIDANIYSSFNGRLFLLCSLMNNGRKNVANKLITKEMLTFIFDNKDPENPIITILEARCGEMIKIIFENKELSLDDDIFKYVADDLLLTHEAFIKSGALSMEIFIKNSGGRLDDQILGYLCNAINTNGLYDITYLTYFLLDLNILEKILAKTPKSNKSVVTIYTTFCGLNEKIYERARKKYETEISNELDKNLIKELVFICIDYYTIFDIVEIIQNTCDDCVDEPTYIRMCNKDDDSDGDDPDDDIPNDTNNFVDTDEDGSDSGVNITDDDSDNLA